MDKDQIEQRWDGTMGQTAISCTDRKLPGSLPEHRLTANGYGKGEMKFASKKKRGAKESTEGTRKNPRRRGLTGLRKEVVEKGSTEETTVPNRKSADAEQVTGGTHATPKKRRFLPWLRKEGVEKAEKAEARRREMEKGRLGGVNEEEEEEEGEDKDEKEYDEADE
jgi:hypothetical protein